MDNKARTVTTRKMQIRIGIILVAFIIVSSSAAEDAAVAAVAAPSSCACKVCPKGQVCEMAYRIGCVSGQSPCEQFPVCVPSDRSCAATKCDSGQKCFLREVVCITAPCYPVPSCEYQCPENEEWRECPSNCEPSCSNQSPICNLACLLKPQCQCKFGFYRGPDGKCVPSNQCKADATCATTSCDECKKYTDDCVCEMVKPQGCVDGKPCTLFPRCIPRKQSCSASPCPPGQRCELREVVCVKAPCWPVRECNPFNCPPNEEWRDCAAFCEPSCTSPAPLCPDVCKPGRCQCKNTFYRRNNMCVPYVPGCNGVTIPGPGG
ncbi:hypothetical protein RB195_013016 [Necator americanus]|uniref:TIL domain-containing protein n=1 Tax=Necator americanus TaxID=51031 RepID=A0ABR1DTM7_NECAM